MTGSVRAHFSSSARRRERRSSSSSRTSGRSRCPAIDHHLAALFVQVVAVIDRGDAGRDAVPDRPIPHRVGQRRDLVPARLVHGRRDLLGGVHLVVRALAGVPMPPEARILIASTPRLICRRTSARMLSGPSTSTAKACPCPPVIVIARPAQSSRGPTKTPAFIASRASTSTKSRVPAFCTVVMPAERPLERLYRADGGQPVAVVLVLLPLVAGPGWAWQSIMPASARGRPGRSRGPPRAPVGDLWPDGHDPVAVHQQRRSLLVAAEAVDHQAVREQRLHAGTVNPAGPGPGQPQGVSAKDRRGQPTPVHP